jgi:excisionase family DNA binding protein
VTEPLLLSVRDAARRLGVGRDFTYRLVREGRLAHLSVGRRMLIPVAALERWIEEELANQEAEAG